MPPKPSLDEKRLRDAKMLQLEFSSSGGAKRSRGQSRPMPDASRNSRGGSASYVQPTSSTRAGGMYMFLREGQAPLHLANILLRHIGAQLGLRRMPQPSLVAQPNLNAVPAARADKDMQDWLNGVSHDKEKKAKVHQSVDKAEKSPRVDENTMSQNVPKRDQAKAAAHTVSHQTEERPQRSVQHNMAPAESTLLKNPDVNTPLSIEAPKPASVPTKGVAVVEASSATILNSRAVQPGCSSGAGTVGDDDVFSGLTIVAQWHLRRQARRKEVAEAKSPDLLDVNSPPLTPPSNFFEKEDMPLSLPAPIVPSVGSHTGPTTPIEKEDLMQFPDSNMGKGFGVLISDPTECRAAEEPLVVGTETSVQRTAFSTIGHEAKTASPVPAEMRLGTTTEAHGAVPQSERCVCNADKPVTTFRGLASSKWANPGYQHRGNFPGNTEMLKHKPACPARVAWEKKHPMESGATLTVQPRAAHLPETFQFVCSTKPKRLNPYALPFCPLKH